MSNLTRLEAVADGLDTAISTANSLPNAGGGGGGSAETCTVTIRVQGSAFYNDFSVACYSVTSLNPDDWHTEVHYLWPGQDVVYTMSSNANLYIESLFESSVFENCNFVGTDNILPLVPVKLPNGCETIICYVTGDAVLEIVYPD